MNAGRRDDDDRYGIFEPLKPSGKLDSIHLGILGSVIAKSIAWC